jgi:hypothetical protein
MISTAGQPYKTIIIMVFTGKIIRCHDFIVCQLMQVTDKKLFTSWLNNWNKGK